MDHSTPLPPLNPLYQTHFIRLEMHHCFACTMVNGMENHKKIEEKSENDKEKGKNNRINRKTIFVDKNMSVQSMKNNHLAQFYKCP